QINGVTISEASVDAQVPGAHFRVYAEATGNVLSGRPGSTMSGIAIAANGVATTVNYLLSDINGFDPPLSGSIDLPANGQFSGLLNQLPGLASLQFPFKGLLHIYASPTRAATQLQGVSVVGLRAKVNERGEFLITTTPPVPVSDDLEPPRTEKMFPHLAIG